MEQDGFSKSSLTSRSPPKNSNEDKIGINKFEELISNMKNDIVNEIKGSIQKVDERINSVEKQVINIIENEKVSKKNSDIEEKNKKRRNIIIKGFIETEKNFDELESNVHNLITMELGVDLDLNELVTVRRLGKPAAGKCRHLLVRLTTERKKIHILRNKMKLKNIYIDHDLTKSALDEKYEQRQQKKIQKKQANDKRRRSQDDASVETPQKLLKQSLVLKPAKLTLEGPQKSSPEPAV
jgi:hypothetical protein